jgi:hypothetical protein
MTPMPPPSLLQRLKERKLVQWALAGKPSVNKYWRVG